LTGSAIVQDTDVGDGDLFTFVNISQSMDRVPFDALIPGFLCVVVAGVVDAARCEKDATSAINGKSVRSKDSKVLRISFAGINVAHR
jgi:hypothetical protein